MMVRQNIYTSNPFPGPVMRPISSARRFRQTLQASTENVVAIRKLSPQVLVALLLNFSRICTFPSALWDVSETGYAVHHGHRLGAHHADRSLRGERAHGTLAKLRPEVRLHDAQRGLARTGTCRGEAQDALGVGNADQRIVLELLVSRAWVRAFDASELQQPSLHSPVDGDVVVETVLHELEETLHSNRGPAWNDLKKQRTLGGVEANSKCLGPCAFSGHDFCASPFRRGRTWRT
mmetsp:Transcript_52703/g.140574  ORF Transcript_52703/g.140574 Transcript_52703/m.140574 type:complete len:235 (+) Transcript_52703:35-739(+)